MQERQARDRTVMERQLDAHGRRISAHDQALGVDTIEGGASSARPPSRRLSTPEPSGLEWYYAESEDAEEEHGPVSFASIKVAFQAGALDPDSVVWNERMEDWLPIRKVPGLIEKLGEES